MAVKVKILTVMLIALAVTTDVLADDGQWSLLSRPYKLGSIEAISIGHNDLVLTPALLEMLGDVKGLCILDTGCGSGDIALHCAREAKVTGVDISERMIKAARDRATCEGLPINFIVGDIENLGMFADGSFDAIICIVAIAGRLSEIIHEFARLLRKGGRLYFADVHPILNKGRQEIRDGKPCLTVSDYFDRSVKSIINPFGPVANGMEIPFFWENYALQDYFDALAKGGFLVQRFLEPVPRPCEIDAEKIAKARSYPYFFLIQAIVPPKY
jgi:SAM-dependent methyltransferase